MVLVHLPTYGYKDARRVFTATNVIPSTRVDSLVQMSPRAILVFRPHASSSGQTHRARNAGCQLSDMGPCKKDTGVIAGVIVRTGIYFPKKAR